MLPPASPVTQYKTGVLNLAEQPDYVSNTCNMMGISRDTFDHCELAENVAARVNQRRHPSRLYFLSIPVTKQDAVYLNSEERLKEWMQN